jgi:hypothetical protein
LLLLLLLLLWLVDRKGLRLAQRHCQRLYQQRQD